MTVYEPYEFINRDRDQELGILHARIIELTNQIEALTDELNRVRELARKHNRDTLDKILGLHDEVAAVTDERDRARDLAVRAGAFEPRNSVSDLDWHQIATHEDES
jgi:predicted phage gp36 major capsid-like protein